LRAIPAPENSCDKNGPWVVEFDSMSPTTAPTPSDRGPIGLRLRLRDGLRQALRAKDRVATAAFRSAMAAVENAATVDGPMTATDVVDGAGIAGSVAGAGAGEVARRELSEADIERIVRAEIADRRDAAPDYERAGQADRARRLHDEADALAALFDDRRSGAGGNYDQ
jgi:uncharacterized protein YqeY